MKKIFIMLSICVIFFAYVGFNVKIIYADSNNLINKQNEIEYIEKELYVGEQTYFYIDSNVDNINEVYISDYDISKLKIELVNYEELIEIKEVYNQIVKEGCDDRDGRLWFKVTPYMETKEVKSEIYVGEKKYILTCSIENDDINNKESEVTIEQYGKEKSFEVNVTAPEIKFDFSGSKTVGVGKKVGFLVLTDSKTGAVPKATSSDDAIVEVAYNKSVDAGYKNGYYMELSGKKEGKAEVTIEQYGKEKSFEVNVTAPEIKFDFSGSKTVGVGKKVGFLVLTDSKTGAVPKATSSDDAIVEVAYNKSVDAGYKNGYYMELSGKKEGKAEVTIEQYGKEKSFEVNVTAPEIKFDFSGSKTVGVGKKVGFLVLTDSKTGAVPKATSSDDAIVEVAYNKSVDAGYKNGYYMELSGKKEGKAEVTIEQYGKEKSFEVNVTAPEIKFDFSGSKTVGVGKKVGFLVLTDSKTGAVPKATSSDDAIVEVAYNKSVDAGYKNGYYMELSGKKEGKAEVTIEQYGKEKSFEVNVTQLGWVTIDGNTYYIENNGNFAKGYKDIDGFKYYFNSAGILSSKVGIDVSKYQTNINWNQVKAAGVEFVIIRVGNTGWGNGSINLDPYFNSHIKGALNAGLDIGIYYYSQAITVAEAKNEANFVINQINKYKNSINMPVVFDTESTGQGGRGDKLTTVQRTQIADAFCKQIKSAGYTPMIYSNLNWLNNNLDMNALAEYLVWVAHYNDILGYTKPFKCWQYTSSGKVSGIPGRVDLNIWIN